jgi:hypothetical protein
MGEFNNRGAENSRKAKKKGNLVAVCGGLQESPGSRVE